MAKQLSLKERAASVGKNLRIIESDPNSPPTTVPGMSGRLHAQALERQQEIDRLKGERGVNKVLLSSLHSVAGRKRKLTDDEYAELRDNLRKNELITPITICKREDGDWDIISGHNRVDIYRDLGFTEIAAYVMENSSDADIKAFYANLLHPSLPDFEKYLGFKKHMASTGISQEQMATESGIGRSSISRLMSFDRLPEAAIEILIAHPTKLGGATANDLAKLVDQGKSDRVVEAVKNIVFNDVTQSAALAMAAKTEAKPAIKKELEIFKIKSGKSNYAEMRASEKTLRIDFKDEKKAAVFATLIYDMLKEHADLESNK